MTRAAPIVGLALLVGCGPWHEVEVEEDVRSASPRLHCSRGGFVLGLTSDDGAPLRVVVEQPTGELEEPPPGPSHSAYSMEVLPDGAVVSYRDDSVSVWDGAAWSHFTLDPPPLWGIDAVGGSSAEHVYLLSWHRLYAREGDAFRAYDPGTWRRASAVAVPGDGRLIVVGERGLVSIHDGRGWVERPAPTRDDLAYVGVSGEHLWTASGRGVWQWDGARWHDRSGGIVGYVGAFAVDGGDVYVSDREGLVQWTGAAWRRLARPGELAEGVDTLCFSATHLHARRGSWICRRPR